MTITGLSKADHADRNHPRWRDRMQSVGVPRTDVEVRVVDDGRELPADEVGEVAVRGDVPPFADVPVSKTLDDLKRLKQEIMPNVEGT
jgi:acyl-CoA synthetase (AMP-forming)/AMP-acid ligase II